MSRPHLQATLFILGTLFGVHHRISAQSAADATKQKQNVQELGVILTPSKNSPTRLVPQIPLLPLQLRDHKLALEKSPLAEREMLQLHLNQEEWQTPTFQDRRPDPMIDQATEGTHPALNQVLLWNHAALDLTSLDHTPPGVITEDGPGKTPKPHPEAHPEFAEQLGPPCSSRALAIVHLAIFEAINTIEQRYPSYQAEGMAGSVQERALASLGRKPATVDARSADENSAIEYAAFTTLASLYSRKAEYLATKWLYPDDDVLLAKLPDNIPGNSRVSRISLGQSIGVAIAEQILMQRANDGSQQQNGTCIIGTQVADLPATANDYPPHPYLWQADPVHVVQTALGAGWGKLPPFVIKSGTQFRPEKPDTSTADFAKAFDDVRKRGSYTSTSRTKDEEIGGKFWAYDGTPGLCAPPRLYNMIVRSIATSEHKIEDPVEMARLLALANVAMADAGIAAWEAKYHYRFARPVTAIRETVVAGGTPYANWKPLGGQLTNTITTQFTPPFPAYPSGHATFGSAVFTVLASFFNLDPGSKSTSFDFVSDEYNGVNLDPINFQPRPRLVRSFASFSNAAKENADSRIYLGIHWQQDATAGMHQGEQVGHAVAAQLYKAPYVKSIQ